MTAARSALTRLATGGAAGALAASALTALGLAAPASAADLPMSPTTSGAVSSASSLAVGRTFDVRNLGQLRRAVVQANQRPGKDRIRLVGNVVFAKGQPVNGPATRGDLDIFDDLVIVGNGRSINANNVDRIFDINAGNRVAIKGVNLRNGKPAPTQSGGAIRSAGDLIVRNSSITRSKVRGEGASGGAIVNVDGSLKVLSSTLSSNRAARAGGAIEADAGRTVVRSSRLSGNRTGPQPGNGGALHLTGLGRVDVVNTRVVRNVASAEGGGLWNSADGDFLVKSSRILNNRALGDEATNGGGGLFNDGGRLVVTNSDVRKNQASGAAGSGGGVLNDRGRLDVIASTFDANTARRAGGAIEANEGATLVLNSRLSANATGAAPGNGGGVHLTGAGQVQVEGSRVEANTAAAEGGGLWNSATGTFSVVDSEVVGNRAEGDEADQGGGGLFNDGGSLSVVTSLLRDNRAVGAAGSGGGILDDGGSLRVESSVIRDNRARRAGGGIETDAGTVTTNAVAFLANATGNNPGNGGAIHVSAAGRVTVTGGSATSNAAANEGGAFWNSTTGVFTATDVQLADNAAPTGPNSYNEEGGLGLMTVNGTLIVPGTGN